MIARLWRWANSIQAHLILLTFGTIAALTGVSVAAILFASGPSLSPVSIYEMTRIVRGLELVRPPLKIVDRGRADRTPADPTPAERVMARLLAARLGVRPETIRVQLEADRTRLEDILAETRLYGPENAAHPIVYGGFTIFVRRADGAWDTFRRKVDYWQARSLRFWRYASYYGGVLIVLPLAMLLSGRISRPVRAFAASADRIGEGHHDLPVPVAGPTEIRQAATALNDMQARIAYLLRERTALVGAIAHDLRTPLSNLRFRVAAADAATRQAAEAEIARMEQLIRSTLSYVDGEGRAMEAEPLDLASLLQTLADGWSDRGVPVALAEGARLTVRGDLVRLRGLFTNLVENGLKFGDRVDLSYRREGDEAVVDVVDDGPGMPEEDLPHAFDPFFRGERSRNRSTGGTGLGLAIADSAARAHGGGITLANLPDGFRARVRLPCAGPPPAGGAERPA